MLCPTKLEKLMKAIHNYLPTFLPALLAVSNEVRKINESNSQLAAAAKREPASCVQRS